MFLYSLRQSSVKLRKTKKHRTASMASMSAKLIGLKIPVENAKTVAGLTLPQLRQRIVKQKDISIVDVVEGFQAKVLQLLDSNSASVAEMIFEADVTAIIADSELTTAALSPIHGIPVVISNNIAVKNEDCNGSLVFKSGHASHFDSVLVSLLKTAGAVPYLLSNQAPIFGDLTGSSRLYGIVKHPSHPDRAVGGSCSGLAVLLRENVAVLGFGIDVLGDVRIPAANCGVVAFRPTSYRISKVGTMFPLPPPSCLQPSISPVATSVASITDAFVSLCLDQVRQFDLTAPCVLFKPIVALEKLTIGMFTSLPGLVPAVPAVERVMGEAKSALERMGHTVVEFVPPRPEELLHLILSSLARNEEFWHLFVCENSADTISYAEALKLCLPKVR